MNILQVNTVDREGGASKIASEVKEYMEGRGNKVSYFVKIKHSKDPHTHILPDEGTLYKLLRYVKTATGKDIYSVFKNHFIKASANDFEYFKSDAFITSDEFHDADIVHLHNLHGNFFPLKSLIKISQQKPVVWTLHDMWSITGHCSHSFDCNRWETGCGHCPYLDTYPALTWDNTNNLWNKKKDIYSQSTLTIVTPSQWIADKLPKSILSKQDHQIIYNGVDTSIFKPLNKGKIRQKLNLPKDKQIIMFLAYGGKNSKWKGGKYLEKVKEAYTNDDTVHFLCIGGSEDDTKKSNDKITYVEKIADPKLLNEYYNAADIFLFPSLAETFPLVILEAMATGLLIVSFDVGGVKEALLHNKNGYISRYKDAKDLIAGVSFIKSLSNAKRQQMSESSITRIHGNFTKLMMMKKYYSLYQQLIDSYGTKNN